MFQKSNMFQIDTFSQIGRQISEYKLMKLIGRGRFGGVYLAKNDDMKVAVKITTDHHSWENERDILRRLNGISGVPRLFWDGNESCFYALTMSQYYRSLAELTLLNQVTHYSFSKGNIQKLLFQIVNILEAVHDKGVLHRDIKPTNLMVTNPEGHFNVTRCVLIDYGLSHVYDHNNKKNNGRYNFEKLMHSPPNVIMNGNPSPQDDLIQLTYCTFGWNNCDMDGFTTGTKDEQYKYKLNLLRNPESHLPSALLWLLPFFKKVSELPLDYDSIRVAIQSASPSSNASGNLMLTMRNGFLKLS
uniref:non-specific serine/threonine protein kinase n=2 Tax=Caenorhabditis tropicalis TaxID=1561998 RepID=A0A1I7TI41_9PELO